MDYLNTALFWAHMMALSLGGVATFGIPLLAARIGSAEPAARPVLAAAMVQFSKIGSAAIGLLILTGAILVFSKYGGIGGVNGTFWLKMVLVVILVGVIMVNKRLGAKARAGDRAAAAQAASMAKVAIVLLASVVLTAALAFP